MSINRREFARQTARAALGAGSLGGLIAASGRTEEGKRSAKPAQLPIVDTHQHLWDLRKLRLAWLKSSPHINRSFVTKDYLEATEGLNVQKAIYMEVAVDKEDRLAEAEYVIGLCKRKDNPTVAAVISGSPGSEDFKQYITRFKGSPYIKGIREILSREGLKRGLWHSRQFVRSVRLLGELGMSFDLCMPPAALLDGAKLAEACPHTRFILDHCGNADPKAFRPPGNKDQTLRRAGAQWRQDIAELAGRKNVVCKISGIVARAPKGTWTADDLAPVINHCLELFGPQRVMFGGDWPVVTRVASFRQWVEALKQIIQNRARDEQRKLLHDNAVRFYGLT